MNEGLWKRLREALHGPDPARALQAENQAIAAQVRGSVDPALQAELKALRGSPYGAFDAGAINEGPLQGERLLVRSSDLLAHMLVLGASGAGKTFSVLDAVLRLLLQQVVRSVFVLDLKGELSELLLSQGLPALATRLPPADADRLLRRIVVVDPFSPTHLPPLNVLVRDPNVDIAIQARDVAECFETATETGVTTRMETILDWVLRLVIEVGGSFLTVRRALQEPAVLEGLVRTSRDRDVVRYFLTRYLHEPKASKLALLARLDRFLALPMTTLCLGASTCLDFDELVRDKIVVVNLGRAPAGLQSVARFFAMVILTRLVRAIFRLPHQGAGGASLLVADEWQVALNGSLAAEFESILALARSRGAFAWLVNQQLDQLNRHGAALRSIVLGQTAIQVAFRLAPEDARTLRHLFPVTGAIRRIGGGGGTVNTPFLSPSEELEFRTVSATRLPNRVAYWSDRRKPWGSILFRSATLDLPSPSQLPAALVDRVRRGVVAYSVADLSKMLDAEERRLDSLAAGTHAGGAAPSLSASPVLTSGPTSTPVPPPPKPRRRGSRGGHGQPPPW